LAGVAFLAGAFLAGAFLAGVAFFAGAFLAGDFVDGAAFLAGAFVADVADAVLAAVFLPALFAAAVVDAEDFLAVPFAGAALLAVRAVLRAGAALVVPADFFTAVNSTSLRDLPVTPFPALRHCGSDVPPNRRAGDPTVPRSSRQSGESGPMSQAP
jgi:hypothetical protein